MTRSPCSRSAASAVARPGARAPLFAALLCLPGCDPAGPGAQASDLPDLALPAIPQGKKPPQGPPDHSVGGFAVDLGEVTLRPGEERNECWVLPLVFEGPSRFVAAGSLTVGPGLHHGNITTRPATGDTPRRCGREHSSGEVDDIALGGAVLFGSSTQISGTEWQHFPDGMAYRVPDNQEVIARMHYLNASARPLTVNARYRWYTIDAKAVTQELKPFAWSYLKFTIPPLARHTVRGECEFQGPMKVVSVLPHMHQMGREFLAGFWGGPLDGKTFLESKGYDPENGVLEQFDPAVDLGQGRGAFFSCTWENTLDKELRNGIGDNEMCILFGYGFPPEHTFSMGAGENWCAALTPP